MSNKQEEIKLVLYYDWFEEIKLCISIDMYLDACMRLKKMLGKCRVYFLL